MRTTRRFAVCRPARLKPAGGRAGVGLLIELSQDGCRFSNVQNHARFAVGSKAQFEIEGFAPFAGEVRWSKDDIVGLAFARALSVAELDTLLLNCRTSSAAA